LLIDVNDHNTQTTHAENNAHREQLIQKTTHIVNNLYRKYFKNKKKIFQKKYFKKKNFKIKKKLFQILDKIAEHVGHGDDYSEELLISPPVTVTEVGTSLKSLGQGGRSPLIEQSDQLQELISPGAATFFQQRQRRNYMKKKKKRSFCNCADDRDCCSIM